jgi:hypothetical protein
MSLTKPSEIFCQKVAPAYNDYLGDPTNEFRANNLAAAVNDHANWTYEYDNRQKGAHQPSGNLASFRRRLFEDCPDLRVMWDLADAAKHRFLDKDSNPPRTVRASTAAFVPEGNDLRVVGSEKLFSEIAANAVKYWKDRRD